MSDLHTPTPHTTRELPRGTARTIWRWLVSFSGYPLGGYVAFLLIGGVDGPGRALAAGLLTGTVLGAVQAWAMGQASPGARSWIAATAVGMAIGVAAGAAVVDYRTDLRSLVVQGVVSGLVVGIPQGIVLIPRLGQLAFVWPLYLSGVFAVGWTVTTAAGIDVDQQFTIFGSSGALAAALLTAALPLVLHRRRAAHGADGKEARNRDQASAPTPHSRQNSLPAMHAGRGERG